MTTQAAAPFTPQPQSRLAAAALMLLASSFIALSTLAAKFVGTQALGPGLPPFMVTGGRFFFAFLGISTALALSGVTVTRPHWRMHLLRTLCGGIGVTLMFAAVTRIPLSEATAISFLNPVFAMILAIPLLGERIGPWRWAAAGIALVGAGILLRPGSGVIAPGALLALGAALVFGLEVTVIKRLSGLEKPLQILLINNGIGCLLFVPLALWAWQTPTPAQWLGLAGVGLAMAAAQFCFVNSLQRADASYAVPFTYAVLIFATLYDALAFGTLPDAVSYLGAAVILAGAALLAWREGRARLKP